MESCTGGEIASTITNIEGASNVFEFSAVTYSNEYKIKLGVDSKIIDKYTVYSIETADEMSKVISNYTNSNYGVGITGKLSRPDINNPYGEDNLVFVSIYNKDNNKYYHKELKVDKITREENKNIIPPTDKELFQANKEKPERISTIKAAILLPFIQDKRMVEYYEGFLMAVDSLKRTGISIELYAYNCGEDKASLNSILAKDEMKKMNIIFGPSQSQHTKTLAEFAKKHDIRMIIPFSSKEDEVFNNPFIYQINTPQSYLYSEVYEHFTRQFPDANVIILEAANTDKDKIEFIKGLKQELKNKGIPVKTLQETATAEMLKNALRNDKENIFIPTSDSDVTLIKIIPQLTLVKRENPEIPFHLFGYPKWQTYTKNHLDSFFELDTYFYSSFYTNNLLPAAINFIKAYHKWYSKDMVINYPQYGMLGFDTGFFFLKGLSKYGSELEKNLSNMDLTPIQTGFKFQRVNNWGGFINKKVFFVHFTKDYELVKLDFE